MSISLAGFPLDYLFLNFQNVVFSLAIKDERVLTELMVKPVGLKVTNNVKA